MMTDKEKLEVIEAFVKKGQKAILIKRFINGEMVPLSGIWSINKLIRRMSEDDIFQVKTTPHRWQNLIDFIKAGDFKGKNGVRFGKNSCDLKELQEWLFTQDVGWAITKEKKLSKHNHEMFYDASYKCLYIQSSGIKQSDYLYYNPDLCQFVEEKPVLVPWTREDVPPVCWIRSIGEIKSHGFCLIIYVYADGLETKEVFRNWETLLNDCEYSTDLKTWKPCGKEGK